jgi:hypothetical protein
MEGNISYDHRNSRSAALRKWKINERYLSVKKSHLNVIIVYYSITIIPSSIFSYMYYTMKSYNEFVILTIASISLYICIFLFYKIDLQPHYESKIYGSFDVILSDKGITMPEWDTTYPKKTKLYPWDYIDRIYLNLKMDYILIVKSEKGLQNSNKKWRQVILYKSIIDDPHEFVDNLRKTGKFIENKKMKYTP